ncbi:Gor1p [Lipomyces kononenkoae]|uniref:Gor1p n=1 Tax=Lipomyces kononenkoae TaxID=34357 RepID=A0ACC3SYJ8_LIPKO
MTKENLRPQILLLGTVRFAHEEWKQLDRVGDLVEYVPNGRDDFFQFLRGLPNLVAIYLTFPGYKAIGGFDNDVLDHLPKTLKYLCSFGAGYEILDVRAIGARGIQVSNTPDTVSDATADTAIYLMIGALRNFHRLALDLRRGNWSSKTPEAHDPEKKVLGILGLGGIGRKIRDRSLGFEFSEIIYHNRTRLSPGLEGDAKYVSFETLLAKSDILCLSVPLNAKTRHIINSEALSKCKDGVFIVNTARGAIIDEEALVLALNSGKVSSVGLDVFEYEPKIHPELLANENVVLLPHVGTHTVETRRAMEANVIDNIRAGLTTGKVQNLVPELVDVFE